MTGVFINYRSADGRQAAEVIYRDIAAYFGSENVFLDKQAILPGVPYPSKIRTWLHKRCSVMVVVIGPLWLTIQDDSGNRLLFRPGDWVHDEIADALSLGLPVLPVPLHDTPLPDVTELPKAIAGLINREEVRIRSFDKYYETHNLAKCIEALDPGLGVSQTGETASDVPAWVQRSSNIIYQGAAQVYGIIYGANLSAALFELTQSLGGSTTGAASVLSRMPDRKAAAVLEAMDTRKSVLILHQMNPHQRSRIMNHLPAEIRYQMATADYTGNG